MPLRALILLLAIGLLLLCHRAFTRKSGRLVLVAWVAVPGTLMLIDFCVVLMAIDAGHCRGEDYACDHWPPTSRMHSITMLLALGIPLLLTAAWAREVRRRRRQ